MATAVPMMTAVVISTVGFDSCDGTSGVFGMFVVAYIKSNVS